MTKLLRLCGVAVLLCFTCNLAAMAARASDQTYDLPDQSILGYQLSALVLVADEPALNCVITPPPDTAARVTVNVFLFDDSSASTPYAYVYGTMNIDPNQRTVCNVDNGPQASAKKTPKRIEIRLRVEGETKDQTVTVPVQSPNQAAPHKSN